MEIVTKCSLCQKELSDRVSENVIVIENGQEVLKPISLSTIHSVKEAILLEHMDIEHTDLLPKR